MVREINSPGANRCFLIGVNPDLKDAEDSNFVHDLAAAIEEDDYFSAEPDWGSQTILVRAGDYRDHEYYLRIFCSAFYLGWSRSCADPPLWANT